jgi:hypothetical protein
MPIRSSIFDLQSDNCFLAPSSLYDCDLPLVTLTCRIGIYF